MANPQRGEVEFVIEGQPYILRYPLGVCVEIMAEFELPDIGDIPKTNLYDLNTLAKFISFGIRGGGGDLTVEQVLSLTVHIQEAYEAVSKAIVLGLVGDRPLPEEPVPAEAGTGESPKVGRRKRA